jgi:hypothetical protein
MKIQKFNESNNFEWNLNDFKVFIDKNNELHKNVHKYLQWQTPKDEKIWYKNIRYYFSSDGKDFVIVYDDDWGGTNGDVLIIRTAKKMNEFLLFISDPNLFLESEKYNI